MRRAGFIMLFVFAGVSAAYAAVEVKTGKLNFTGTGAPLTGAPTGASINVTAGKILFTGTREPLTAPTGTSGPVEVRTPGISFNGTNSM